MNVNYKGGYLRVLSSGRAFWQCGAQHGIAASEHGAKCMITRSMAERNATAF